MKVIYIVGIMKRVKNDEMESPWEPHKDLIYLFIKYSNILTFSLQRRTGKNMRMFFW